MSILADASGLLVLLDADHALHTEVRRLAEQENIVVPTSVLCEVDFMATTRLGATTAQTFLEDVVSGAYTSLAVDTLDMTRALELMRQFRDARIGFVDASIVALAERYRLPRILTLDRRHFGLFRPKGLTHLELLP